MDRSVVKVVRKDTVFQIGVAPCRIDILNRIDGMSSAEASEDPCVVHFDGLDLPFISRDRLIRNKLASGRAKDRADVDLLRGE